MPEKNWKPVLFSDSWVRRRIARAPMRPVRDAVVHDLGFESQELELKREHLADVACSVSATVNVDPAPGVLSTATSPSMSCASRCTN